jgi:biotin transport system substrate-specific component
MSMTEHGKNIFLKDSSIAGMMTALTALGAFIKIPGPLVPMTLQTFFTSLSGLILSPVMAALSQIMYLILGLLGLPIFAQGGGIGYIVQPTFGYLLSLPLTALLISMGIRRMNSKHTFLLYFIYSLFGNFVTLALGTIWLYYNMKYFCDISLSWKSALVSGAILFIPGSILNASAASYLALLIKNRTGNQKI